MDEKQIVSLMEQARASIDPMDVYNHTLLRLNIDELKQAHAAEPLRMDEVGANFAYAGFLEGIEFTLRNLILKEGE